MPTPKEILKFYKSKEWQRARNLKIKSQFGICEQCGKVGNEVHHKVPLTTKNLHDPKISLSQTNLELLCTSCHNQRRENIIKKPIRDGLMFTKDGNIVAVPNDV